MRETVDHLASVIEEAATPPIIMGHSFGGTLTQLLVDRGLGVAAVAIDSRDDRAPLLFIGGSEDHIMPPAVNKSNAKHYHKSAAVTEYHQFPGRSYWIYGTGLGRGCRLRAGMGPRPGREARRGASGRLSAEPPAPDRERQN